MTWEEFARHAEAWGADVARWPESVRGEATAMAAAPEADAILAQQRQFDAMLAQAAPHLSSERINRALFAVVTRLAEEKPRARLADYFPRWLIPATGIACAVAIGALVAFVDPLSDTGPDDLRAMLSMFFDANVFGQGWIVL